MVIWDAFHWHKVTSRDPCIQQWLEITFQKEWCHNGIFANDSNTFRWHFVPPLIFSSHYISWWSLARLYCFSCLLLDFFILSLRWPLFDLPISLLFGLLHWLGFLAFDLFYCGFICFVFGFPFIAWSCGLY